MLRHTIEQSFAAPQHAQLYLAVEEPEVLLDALIAWQPPPLGEKWTDRR